MQNKTALITGAGKRVGASIARTLHQAGMNIAIHYRASKAPAEALAKELNEIRKNSAITIQADLANIESLPTLVEKTQQHFGSLDVLINNASSFYPTKIGEVTEKDWQDLFKTNAQAPFFLAQAAAPYLMKTHGCIVNMVDVHAERPLQQHAVYCMAKAALAMMTKSLAKELAPEVRVNGVAPGIILWPDEGVPDNVEKSVLKRVVLKRPGQPQNVADAILFLVSNDYVTGQIIAVDGGRLLHV